MTYANGCTKILLYLHHMALQHNGSLSDYDNATSGGCKFDSCLGLFISLFATCPDQKY